jgi:hypothetical protein
MATIVRGISRSASRWGVLAAALTLALSIHVAHADQDGNSQGGNQGGNSQGGGGHHGGPAPLIGAGLPAVLLIGAGAYLAYRRSRPTD